MNIIADMFHKDFFNIILASHHTYDTISSKESWHSIIPTTIQKGSKESMIKLTSTSVYNMSSDFFYWKVYTI